MALGNTKIVVERANQAVRNLRTARLSKGLPFMINSRDLEDDKCFLEYPDGKISLVQPNKSRTAFSIIKYLSPDEAQLLRIRYNLG
ncbi:MAG: hypothetical protein J7539_01745 [Niabella sp.]|nr:hypothetical protein [Niabella sp.]